MRVTTPLIALSALFLIMCGGDSLPTDDPPPPITILGAKLIDGSGGPPIDDSVVVIRGTRVQAAGPRSHTPVPKGGEIIDGTGKVIIPGLIDLHCHYFGGRAEVERALRTQLYFGVTTARSIGADPLETLAVFADGRAGKIPAPRLYTAGLGFTHPQGHPVDLIVNRPATEDEARKMVRELAAQRVDFVKMWVESINQTVPKISAEIQTAVVQEAAKHDIPSVAHISDEEDVHQLAALGVTDFLHTVRDREAVDDSFVQMCKSKGLTFTPTLSVAQSGWYFAENPEALNDPELRQAFSPEVLDGLTQAEAREQILANPQLAQSKKEYATAERFVKQMQQAGVKIGAGSDSGAGNVATGWGTHREMELLVAAGLSPMDAIVAATSAAAQIAERRKSHESGFGQLAAGQAADLLLLEADPLADIKNTRKIDRVMQAGKWVERNGPVTK